MNRIAILIAALAVTILAGCASTSQPPAAAPEAPLTQHDANAARAVALQAIGTAAKDAETQRLAIFALLTMDRGVAAPPVQPQVVVQPARSVGEFIVGFAERVLMGAERLAVPYLTYKGQVNSNATNRHIADTNATVTMRQSDNFLALGLGGVQGTAAVGTAAVNAFGGAVSQLATAPRTAVTVSGNSGNVVVGPGSIDTRRTCTGGNGQAGTGTATVPAGPGQGGAAGC